MRRGGGGPPRFAVSAAVRGLTCKLYSSEREKYLYIMAILLKYLLCVTIICAIMSI